MALYFASQGAGPIRWPVFRHVHAMIALNPARHYRRSERRGILMKSVTTTTSASPSTTKCPTPYRNLAQPIRLCDANRDDVDDGIVTRKITALPRPSCAGDELRWIRGRTMRRATAACHRRSTVLARVSGTLFAVGARAARDP